jgi:hypothetical protein
MCLECPAYQHSQTKCILERDSLFYKVRYAGYAIIAPELIFFRAVESYFVIRDTLQELNELPEKIFEVRAIYLPLVSSLFLFITSRYDFLR